jgi:hypothetical protein
MKQQPKDEFDEFEAEEEQEETEEEPRQKGRPPIRKEMPKSFRPEPQEEEQEERQAKPKEETEDRFAAFHMPERIGILDKKNNKVIAEDIMTAIAEIKNDLQKIKEAVI